MKRSLTAPISIALVLPLVLSACKRQVLLPAQQAHDPIVVPAIPVSDSDADAAERERLERERVAAGRVTESVRATMREPIHFEFDRFDLSRATRSILDAKIQVMLEDRSLRVRVEGHADQRGSPEYNLALGQRRAAAARRYLILRDIAAERIEIATFGEEKPHCVPSAEWCWRLNRRDEFVVIP